MRGSRTGVWLGLAAYAIWGLFPLYFPLLKPASPYEILGQRILWSAITMVVLVVVMRHGRQVLALAADRRVRILLTAAAVAVTVNWGTYIWAVNHGHVVETSLGYFVNPLVSVLFGVAILGERLRRWQWVAVSVGAIAVVVLTVDLGRLPYIALTLALSFGSYGLLKKLAAAPAMESLAFETLVLAPLAVAALIWLGTTQGQYTFTDHGTGHALLLACTGVITAVPLMLFGASVTRVRMTTLGLMQYLAPILQFAIGITVDHEHMSRGRWIGFGIVWLALAIFTVEQIAYSRRTSLQPEPIEEPV